MIKLFGNIILKNMNIIIIFIRLLQILNIILPIFLSRRIA